MLAKEKKMARITTCKKDRKKFMLQSVLRSRSRGDEIKLPPGAGAEITNCGSGSFLFTPDLKKFYFKKIMVIEETFVNCYNFNPMTFFLVKKVIFKKSFKLSGAGAEIRICGSMEPEPKEIVSAPQHW
jgi:hypothetical protein